MLQKVKTIMATRAKMKAIRKPIEVTALKAYATSVRRTAKTVTISFRYEDGVTTIIRVELSPGSAAKLANQLRIKE